MAQRILIIDDDREDLETIQSILEKEGYDVVAVQDGASALDALTGEGFSLILIDVQMPTLSGYDLLRLFRERLSHDVPMMYVTIVPEKDVDMRDIDGFVQKPFTPEILITKVREVLKSGG